MKTCFKCARTLPLSEFYRHPMMGDGHLGKCKDCTRADVKANREAKREQYRAYERERTQTIQRKVKMWKYGLRAQKRHPVKNAARQAVTRAVRSGKLTRQPCEVCGTTEGVQAHHPDYTRKLDVRWLCVAHHHAVHAAQKAG